MVATQQSKMPNAAGAEAKSSAAQGAQGSGLKRLIDGATGYAAQAARLQPGGPGSAFAPEPGQAAGAAAAATREQKGAPAPEKKGTSFGDPDPGNRLAGVHPTFADFVRRVIEIAHGKGLDIFVAQGMRTIAEQNALYAQGRTKKGKVVTWVRGGSSYHNYGVAADFAFHGDDPYSETHDWKGLVASVREAGLVSGASYGDRPHCNLDVPMTSLKAWYKKGGIRNVWDKVSEQVGGPRFGQDGGESEQSEKGGEEKKGPSTGGGKCGPGEYTVQAGDTLIDIAQRLLGDDARWQEIANINGVKDARELAIGRVLKLPTGPSKCEMPTDVGGEAAFRQRSHVVKPGDTLSGIAKLYYGLGSLWQAIATANGITDASKLEVGQKLVIPRQGSAPSTVGQAPKHVPKSHVVAPGETLGEIAYQYYHDAERWRDIAKANGIQDPRKLARGQKLILPQ